MSRKKKKVIALEVIEVNATWDYSGSRILTNFICNEDDIDKTMIASDRNEYWKHEKNYVKERDSIFAKKGTRGASDVFFTDYVSVDEVKLPPNIKASTKYVYKIYDYSNDKLNVELATQKDVISYLTKKIKTKYVLANYNGKSEKFEYVPKTVAGILDGLEETTSQFTIEPYGRSGGTGDEIMITIFKNYAK